MPGEAEQCAERPARSAALEQLHELERAQEILTNPVARQAYDRLLMQERTPYSSLVTSTAIGFAGAIAITLVLTVFVGQQSNERVDGLNQRNAADLSGLAANGNQITPAGRLERRPGGRPVDRTVERPVDRPGGAPERLSNEVPQEPTVAARPIAKPQGELEAWMRTLKNVEFEAGEPTKADQEQPGLITNSGSQTAVLPTQEEETDTAKGVDLTAQQETGQRPAQQAGLEHEQTNVLAKEQPEESAEPAIDRNISDLGWSRITDRISGISLTLPAKLFPSGASTGDGQDRLWISKDGRALFRIYSRRSPALPAGPAGIKEWNVAGAISGSSH